MNKGNQAMKFGFFSQNRTENEARERVPDLFFVSIKALYEAKASGLPRSFNIFQ